MVLRKFYTTICYTKALWTGTMFLSPALYLLCSFRSLFPIQNETAPLPFLVCHSIDETRHALLKIVATVPRPLKLTTPILFPQLIFPPGVGHHVSPAPDSIYCLRAHR